jgi:hypothetical protein
LVKQYASTFVFFFSNRNNMKNKKDVNLDLLWFVFLPGAWKEWIDMDIVFGQGS